MSEAEYKLRIALRAAEKAKISRRDFIQLASLAGLTFGAANTMFAQVLRAQPKKGGTFKTGLGHGETGDSLDPATWTNNFMVDMAVGVFGAQLTSIDRKNSYQPHLAETIEHANNASRWVFKLRRGLTFHNGKSV